jgi:hypothetical protein
MASYEDSVFLNCPFDSQYRAIFYALVFAVHDCGDVARCALEVDDSGLVRIQKIEQIIADCRFGIHDISRVEPDPLTHLPRFNMPLELGLFLGAKRYGNKRQKSKSCKILDADRYRFQKFVPTSQDKTSLRIAVIRKKLSRRCATGSVKPGAMF